MKAQPRLGQDAAENAGRRQHHQRIVDMHYTALPVADKDGSGMDAVVSSHQIEPGRNGEVKSLEPGLRGGVLYRGVVPRQFGRLLAVPSGAEQPRAGCQCMGCNAGCGRGGR